MFKSWGIEKTRSRKKGRECIEPLLYILECQGE